MIETSLINNAMKQTKFAARTSGIIPVGISGQSPSSMNSMDADQPQHADERSRVRSGLLMTSLKHEIFATPQLIH